MIGKPNETIYIDYGWSIEIHLKGSHAGCWSFEKGIGKPIKGLTYEGRGAGNYCTIAELLAWLAINKPEVYEKYRIVLEKLAKGVTK